MAMLNRKRSSLGVRLWRRCVPELDLFPPHESDRAFRRAAWNWQTNLSITAMGIVGFVIGLCVPPILHSMFPLHHLILALIRHSSLFGFIFWGMWLSRTRIRRKLRQELISIGVLICGPCGYDLRGLTEPRCPECGAPFEEQLLNQMASPRRSTPKRRHCHGCGCDLHGEVEPRCPKCGREFERGS